MRKFFINFFLPLRYNLDHRMMKRKTYTNRSYRTTYKRRKYGTNRKVPKPLRTAIKKTMNRQLETKKCYQQGMTVMQANFQANTMYTDNILYNIPQNATEGGRIGDRINISKVVISGEFQCQPTDNVFWHLYIFRSALYNDNTTPPLYGIMPYSRFYHPVGSIVNPNVDLPDPDQVRILKYKRIRVDPANNGGICIRRFYLSVNMKNAAYQYATDGSSYGRNYNLYFGVICRGQEGNQLNITEQRIFYKDA
ncbi:capsid protein [Giant panda circovirus 4]|uniref:capsid protein n=1 Tax=Giant panda circovirus 4 TaxID=2016459 RepID=UPI000B5BC6E7|nr:capsid protein [Giant panda circovirus 4]ASH99190.1 capsid protein [Giant panda circovirus 4]